MHISMPTCTLAVESRRRDYLACFFRDDADADAAGGGGAGEDVFKCVLAADAAADAGDVFLARAKSLRGVAGADAAGLSGEDCFVGDGKGEGGVDLDVEVAGVDFED